MLLVEDLRNMHILLQGLCTRFAGARLVGAVSTEATATVWLDEHPGAWDLAVIDLVLEKGSSLVVIERAKDTHPAGKVVIFSGYTSPRIQEHCLRLGADAVFHKTQTEEFFSWLDDLSRDPRSQH
jgi:DNA-binding NarL/FixJ family response regulator